MIDLVHTVQKSLPRYLDHLLREQHQVKAIKYLKTSLTESEVLVHIDFSENYCKYSTETQGVHFGASRQQLTLHTGVAYKKDYTRGFCSISQSLRHDAIAVTAHLIPVLQHYLKNLTINVLHVVSDGPSTQYRNKTIFYMITEYLVCRQFHGTILRPDMEKVQQMGLAQQ